MAATNNSLSNTKRNILLYDNLEVHGGAELVTKLLFEELPFDQLVVNKIESKVFNTLPFKNLSSISSLSSLNSPAFLSPLVSTINFLKFTSEEEFGTVIVSGIYAPLVAKNIKAKQLIYYCHTPPRFLSDLKEYYSKNLSFLNSLLLKAFAYFYKPKYQEALEAFDLVIANSANVQQRLLDYFNTESIIVSPPAHTEEILVEKGEYFLSTARIEPYKRVDLIVEAFTQIPNKRLIVMSGGSQLDNLQEKYKHYANIEFTGWVDEKQKNYLIQAASATIYIPKNEDYGISPVESTSLGVPVIGVREGGLVETLTHNKDSILLPSNLNDDQLLKELEQAIIGFNSENFHIEKKSQKNSTSHFINQFVRFF